MKNLRRIVTILKNWKRRNDQKRQRQFLVYTIISQNLKDVKASNLYFQRWRAIITTLVTFVLFQDSESLEERICSWKHRGGSNLKTVLSKATSLPALSEEDLDDDTISSKSKTRSKSIDSDNDYKK